MRKFPSLFPRTGTFFGTMARRSPPKGVLHFRPRMSFGIPVFIPETQQTPK